MKSYIVLCNIFSWGKAYGKKGDTVTVPESIGEPLTKGDAPKLKLVSEKK